MELILMRYIDTENKYKFNIGDIFDNGKKKVEIIDRCIMIRKKNDKTCISGYANLHERHYKFKCYKCGFDCSEYYDRKGEKHNEYWVIENNFLKTGCPVCSNKIVVKNINNVALTHPHVNKFLKNKIDGERFSFGSSRKIETKYPFCEEEKKKRIVDIVRYNNNGCNCSDKISYPNKFVYNFLKQLLKKEEIDKFNTEVEYEWLKGRKYDFEVFFENKILIIEVNGEQHYGYKNLNKSKFNDKSSRTLREEQQNDSIKCWEAYKNKIDCYIQLDCRKSNIKWISNSILNSELNNLFDLSNINWIECGEYAEKNLVKEVCDWWNNKTYIQSSKDCCKEFGISHGTVREYLIRGDLLKWCKYNPEIESNKGIPVEVFKDGVSLGIYKNTSWLSKYSEKILGVKLLSGSITNAITGKRQTTHKGFTFKQRFDVDEKYFNKILDK